jgi:ABC-type dipeptide/oligopeptide/nickel transport system permease component
MLSRLGQGLVTVFLASLVVFVLIRAVPGDPAVIMLGEQATLEDLGRLRSVMRLDRPLYEQYMTFLGQLLAGDLGMSIRFQRPAGELVKDRLGATAALAGAGLGLACLIGVPIGVLGAVRASSLTDRAVRVAALLSQAVPGFWLGLVLITIFAVQLRVLPASGGGDFSHLILPAITLASFLLGLTIRLTRASILDVLKQDFIRTARSKGLAERVIAFRHALSNALIPVVTVLGLQVGTLLGGAVITEAVFAWPGIGNLAVLAIYQRDYPVVQAVVLLSAVVFVVTNILVDLLCTWIDPRLRRS